MSMRRLVTVTAFLAVFAMAARFSIDSDTWWHLRAGEWMVENRAILNTDPFSYTRFGAAWQYPGWLVEIGMYAIYQLFGFGGLNIWTALMVTATFGFLWVRLAGGVFLRAFVMILAAAASGIYWAARPYLVTFLMAAVYIWVLEGWRGRAAEERRAAKECRSAEQRRTPEKRRTLEERRSQSDRRSPRDRRLKSNREASRRLWLLPALMVIWVNCHGGFIVGFILLGIYALPEALGWITSKRGPAKGKLEPDSEDSGRDPESESNAATDPAMWTRRFAAIGLLMMAAAAINPHGPAMLLYPFKTLSIGVLGQYIQEWQPPNFHSTQVQPFVWLLLVSFGAVGFSRRRLALTDFLLFSIFAYLSFSAARNISLFALAASPMLARHAAPIGEALGRRFKLQSSSDPTPSRLGWLNLGILLVLVLAVAVKTYSVLPLAANQAEIDKTMPVEAVEWIRENRPPGRLFNTYNWGGYLLWALPEYPVFIDGRTDLYDDALVNEWVGVVQAQKGWEEVLDRWGVRLVLVEHGLPLERQLEVAGWRREEINEEESVWMK